MKELEIQKYLRHNIINGILQEGTLEFLAAEYGIYSKVHSAYPHIRQFTYDMIEGKFSERIVQECRGIILDESNNWAVLAYPYDKFWEADNVLADKLDWSTTRVLEKVDGSLCTLWFNPYSTQWEVATRGTPDASGQVGFAGKSFKELFWEVWNKLGYELPNKRFNALCFMFELCTLENKVVCVYKEPRIICHGLRYTSPEVDYSELPIHTQFSPNPIAAVYGWEIIKSFPMTNLDEILVACEALDPISHEGYVCVDANFKRIKCKSIQYKALSHIKDGFGKKRLTELVRQESADTFTKYFPEYLDMYNEVRTKYEDLLNKIDSIWKLYFDIAEQKEFAIAITKALNAINIPFSGALFSLRAGKVDSIDQYFKEININTLVEYLT